MKKVADAPVWYGAEQADAWADGYNSALEGCSPIADPYRDTVKKLAAVREKRLAELAEENAQLRAELAKKRPETLPGMVAEVYGELDAEDCAMIDREWARMRGYILPTNGTRTLTRPAPQPSSCLNCGDPSNAPFCGTCREMGCTSPLGELLAKICAHEAVNEAMADSWNDICSDTGCHPLDIEHGKGKHLTFSPNHWANQVAKRLFVRALRLREKPSPPVKNDHADEAQASAPSSREALRPFAAVAAVDIGSDEADGDMFSSINHHNAPRLTVGDFRRALAALTSTETQAGPELTATCTKLLPGGIIDDSTYSRIEDALDAIEAPMTGDGGRYLTIAERIAALPHKAMREQGQNVWIVESDGIPYSVWLTERSATSLVHGYIQRGNRASWRVVPAILMRSMSAGRDAPVNIDTKSRPQTRHMTGQQVEALHGGPLKSAAEKALNYIENTENELGIKLSCGDALREALK